MKTFRKSMTSKSLPCFGRPPSSPNSREMFAAKIAGTFDPEARARFRLIRRRARSMDLFTRDDLRTLLAEHQSPCVSLYVPIEHGGGKKNSIRWKTCLKEAEEQLVATGRPSPSGRHLLEPARLLLEDPTFWKHQSDGLACFLAPDFLRLYRLPLRFREGLVVGDRFHIKPLVPLLSESGRFYVLALSQKAVRLLQGTWQSVSDVDLKGVPHN